MRPLFALAALAVAGCASTAPPPADTSGRPDDGLLARPDLQAIVDLQIHRDGAALADSLASPDSLVRARTAFALGSVQDKDAVPALRRLLSDDVPAVRADAAFALGQSADSTVGVALVVSLRHEGTPAVLVEVLDALGKVGGQADLAAALAAELPEAVEPARALAVARFGMRDVTSDDAAAWLAARVRAPDAALRQRVAYALTRTPVAAWQPYADSVRDAVDALPGDPARMDLVRALGRLRDTTDVARLSDALATDADWRTRVNAARALAAFDRSDVARDALARAVDDPNPHVAQTAAAALSSSPAALALAQRVIADEDRPWPVQAALLPLVAADSATTVLAWADRQSDPFAQAAALRALGASDDGTALTRLFTTAASDDTRLAAAALEALVERWKTGTYGARRFFDAFAGAVRRADLATTSLAAPALADSAFWALGAGQVLRETYDRLHAPDDLEPMEALVRAIGRVRDGGEIEFLVGVALQGPVALRTAASEALNDRLAAGVDVDVTGVGAPATTTVDWDHLRRVGRHPRLVLETTRGRVVIEMDTEAAPQTVQRITTTAASGLYDGVPFHRVVANFVVQTGDYVRGDGYGGPETPVRSEFTRIPFETGVVGMASSGKDTEGSQFFVTHSPQLHLDGRYTAFGRVVEGMDVVDQILQGDVIREARVVPDRPRR